MTSEKSPMIKRRRLDTLSQGVCGLFYRIENDPNPIDGWVSNFNRDEKGGFLIYDKEDLYSLDEFVYWVYLGDILEAVSEDFVEIPSKEFA